MNSASYIIGCSFHRTCTGWCSLHNHITKLNVQHVCTFFLQFCKNQMYCWYICFDVQILLLLYSVAWVGAVSNMCDICLYLLFSGIPDDFSLKCEFLINSLDKISQKFIKVSFVLRKYLICRYAFTSVHAMKNQNVGWSTRTFPMALSNPIKYLVMPPCIKVLWLFTVPLYM